MNLNVVMLKRGLLAFWALWNLVVCFTNLCDGLKTLGVLGAAWKLTSGNYPLLVGTTALYGTPPWINAVLFLGVISWEGASAFLFWTAYRRFGANKRSDLRAVHAAFTVSLALWAAFILADEIFLAYGLEGTHLHIFTGQLATLLVIHLLPD